MFEGISSFLEIDKPSLLASQEQGKRIFPDESVHSVNGVDTSSSRRRSIPDGSVQNVRDRGKRICNAEMRRIYMFYLLTKQILIPC